MSQEIELYSKLQDPIAAIEKMGVMVAKSGLFGVEKTETGMMLAWACMAERKSPFQVLREYHIIDNRLSDRADSMLAKFIAAGGRHKVISRTADKAEVELVKGDQSQKFSLSWDEAQKEPFVHDNKGGFKKNWRTPRARMQTMWARVVSDGVRAMDPGTVAGIYTPEEIEDSGSDVGTPKEIVLTGAPTPVQTATEAAAPKRGRPAKTAEAPPIEVATEKVPEAKSEPVAEKKEEPKPAPAPEARTSGPFVAKQGADGKLDTDTVKKLFEIIGDNQKAALDWFKKKTGPWEIKNDELATLNVVKAQLIIDKADAFLKQIGVTSAAKPA